MIKPSKKLIKFIDMHPTRKAFADKLDIDEATLSRVLSGDRDMPESMIVSIQKYLEWPLDDLVEIVEDKDGHA